MTSWADRRIVDFMSNDGYVDVATAPAGETSTTVAGLGTFAALAGPTVAADGTVVLGTREGKVVALHADGSAHWNRHLPVGETIVTSPAVGSDGSIYVTGVLAIDPARDHRSGAPHDDLRVRIRATLYRFSPSGAEETVSPFPLFAEQGPSGVQSIGGATVWRFGDDEAVIIPAIYPTWFGEANVHLLAFSHGGAVIADWSMYLNPGDVTGGSLDDLLFWLPVFHPGVPPQVGYPSMPGVAVKNDPHGQTPSIVYVDQWNNATIAFTFCVGASCSPAPGFTERDRRSHGPRTLLSSATILGDGQSIVGTNDGVVFGGPSVHARPPISGLGRIHAAPTVGAGGRAIVVSDNGEVIGIRNGAVISRVSVNGQTIAQAAASRTHVFVATTAGLHTLDASATTEVLTLPWDGGGVWPPVIGPAGHVYAMASNVLFVFPPPKPSQRAEQSARTPAASA